MFQLYNFLKLFSLYNYNIYKVSLHEFPIFITLLIEKSKNYGGTLIPIISFTVFQWTLISEKRKENVRVYYLYVTHVNS